MVSGTGWNNGNPINAAPANLSDADKEKVWQLISEDYRPFHLNITTSGAVFNTYPKTKRMRCIFTPTNTAAPGAGGVAYLGSFRWNDDTPCWVFNSGAKAAGEAGSHEVGRTLVYRTTEEQHPMKNIIMARAPGRPSWALAIIKHWYNGAKGEYANPSTTQDDLAMISSTTYGVGYRADDYSNGITAAGSLTIDGSGNVNNAGVIERTGDVDMFTFTTNGGTLNLTFNPNAYTPNLDIVATLYNSAGTAITSSNPTALNATINSTLTAGNILCFGYRYGFRHSQLQPATPITDPWVHIHITGTITGGSTPTGIAIFYKDCNYTGSFAVGLNAGTLHNSSIKRQRHYE